MAQRFAARSPRVCYIATSQPGNDVEMMARVERHRAERPASWNTIEEPLRLDDAIEQAARDADAVLVDCLTIWLSNIFWEHRNGPLDAWEDPVRLQLSRIAGVADSCRIILVSNEVGSGTVPEAPLARAFRDAQGQLNQRAAELADEVILTVAGFPLYLKTAAPQ